MKQLFENNGEGAKMTKKKKNEPKKAKDDPEAKCSR